MCHKIYIIVIREFQYKMNETKILKEEKIKQLNDSIRNTLRLTLIFLIIAAVIIIGLFVCSIILIIAETKFIYSENNDIAQSLLESTGGFLSILIFCIIMAYEVRTKKKEYKTNKFIYIILFMHASLLILGAVMGIVYSIIYIALGKLASLIGVSNSLLVGMGLEIIELFVLVGAVCLLVSCCNVVKKYKLEYADEIQKHNERKKQLGQQQAEEKQHEKELNTVIALLSKAGNKFFVKYYFELKDWSEPDILDIIQEDYTEETKIQRIRKGQEIFTKRLNKLALEIIADSANNAVDEETKQKANKLLEQIK